MKTLYDALELLDEWENETIKKEIEDVAGFRQRPLAQPVDVAAAFELNMGKLGQPLRVAVTGTGISPNIDDTVRLMGKDKTLKRLKKALNFIEMRAAS